jgi:hypothetical protein
MATAISTWIVSATQAVWLPDRRPTHSLDMRHNPALHLAKNIPG